MSHLAREGMRPITEGFADAWREYSGHEWKPSDKPLRGTGVTREQFADALDALGIRTAKELAELLGLSREQAGNIRRGPGNMLAKHLRKLQSRYREVRQPLFSAYMEAHQAAESYPHDDEYRKCESKAREALRGLDERCAPLSNDGRKMKAREWVAREFSARALIDGYMELSERDRETMLRMLSGMLMTGHGEQTRAGMIARELKETRYGSKVDEIHLIDVIGCNNIWHRLASGLDAIAVLDEYAGGDQRA